jgi:hypothetical protein
LRVTAVSLAGLALLPKIPQAQAYHEFADQRTLLGIPNFWNVVSNIPFVGSARSDSRGFATIPRRSCCSSALS